ncbi:MAG: flagellin FliC3 [Lachnospiraceae bacterium]|nr:flagellin FliC3 [Lachnospiraceae bacterium]
MRINYNASAVISNKALNQSDSKLSQSLQRLSSGLKLNRAQDNPAGLAIANRMDSQVKGLGVAKNNTNDGISVISTAEGALSEMSAIIQRMNQLAVQAGTDTNTDGDKALLDQEYQQLKSELTRIAKDTDFNGMPLLDGSFDLKGYTDNPKVTVDYYSQDVPVSKDYKIDFSLLSDDPVASADAFTIPGITAPDTPSASGYKAEFGPNGDKVTLTGPGDFKLTVAVDKKEFAGVTDVEARKNIVKSQAATAIDITGMGAMKIQIGANEGQELAMQIPTVSLYRLGLDESDIKTMDTAQKAIDEVKGALDYVNDIRSRLGAYQNRLEHNATSVDVSNENLTAAYSRIMDVDMAEEMTEYTTQQVLVQAGTSMLAQANERPQQVLQLLQ